VRAAESSKDHAVEGRTREVSIRGSLILGTLLAGLLPAAAVRAQERPPVSGVVRSARDSTPLQGVVVTVDGAEVRTVTDEQGRFVLRNIPLGPVRLFFSRLGVATDSVTVTADRQEVVVLLQLQAVPLPALTAQALPPARERFEQSVQPSVVTIDRETIARLPSAFEADVVRAVQLLPGTVALNDYTVGFNVRGGEPDQNLTQLDGTTILNPSHLGGLFSTFDPNAVDEVNFLTGAFPAEYGGRLSSVLDVTVRPGRHDRFGVQGAVSLLATKLLAEGPIGRGGASWLVAARRTYADVLAGALTSETIPYHFWDGMAKLAVPLGRTATLSATGYMGRDVLDWLWNEARPGQEAIQLTGQWGNRLAGIRYDHALGRHRVTVDAGVSEFVARFGLEPGLLDAENTARILSLKSRVILKPGAAHEIRVGAGVDDFRIRYGAASQSFGATFLASRYAPRIWSVFAEDEWRVVSRFLLRPGARFESVEGADAAYLDPRLGAKLFLTPAVAVTASVGVYHQALHSLRDQNLPWNIFDFWIAADSAIPVARSRHVVGGIEWWMTATASFSIEAYHKDFRDIIDANLEEDPGVQGDEVIPVQGDAWGLDVLLRRHWGRVTGWVAYGYTRATRTAADRQYPAVQDRRHTLNVVVEAPGPFGADLGLRVGYGSPLPYTPFVGEWDHRFYRAATHSWDDFEREPIASGDLNSARFPYYGRVDVSLRWEVEKWGGILRPYVQVANLLNRRNVFLYFYDYSASPATRTAFSQLPVLPSVGVEFVF
jgi:hypothetical protein